MKMKVMLGLLCLATMNSHAANNPAVSNPESGEAYIGLYQDWVNLPYEQEGGTIYRNTPQSILIKRNDDKGSVTIDINTVAANGNTCSYHGVGRWYQSKDRFEFSNASELDADTDNLCKLAVIIKNNSAYVITQTPGCELSCGVRNSLDGWIIKRSN